MSVADFELVVSCRPDLRLAIVSEALFYALDELGKIEIKQIRQALPTFRRRTGPVLKFLQDRSGEKAQPLVLTYFILKERPEVHIEFGTLHALRVDDVGLNSYVLCESVGVHAAAPKLCA